MGWNLLEHRQQEVPVLFDAGDVALFVGTMGMLDGWAEADHVHARVATAKNAALEASVYRVHDGLVTVQILIDTDHQSFDVGVRVGCPTGIRSSFLHLKVFLWKRGSNFGCQFITTGFDAAASQKVDGDGAVGYVYFG